MNNVRGLWGKLAIKWVKRCLTSICAILHNNWAKNEKIKNRSLTRPAPSETTYLGQKLAYLELKQKSSSIFREFSNGAGNGILS